MANESGAPAKGVSAWGQVVTAVVLVGGLGAGLWTFTRSSSADSTPPAATCSDGQPAKASGTPRKRSGTISGAQLCAALNRPDLADLLGTPGETAKSASSSTSSLTLAGGKQIPNPSARVELGTYTVNLQASYDQLPVGEYAKVLGGDARPRTVLGRTAVLYSDRTIRVSFRLDGGDSHSGPGVPARSLLLSLNLEDSGGSYEMTLWRTDGGAPDDAVLVHLAEEVLPTLPGWTAR
ncbi:DUF6215 domain-containing protein [Actinacidiphila acidipaludis]|uniref:DUF6215 domain-containing protein n=1 Tax=Actinacidiphila acidipaludis TaxID=2873382 RepID=A0ABS7QJ29_9ACTN|nr:DUF6215 domain-containing protein [Streptomyces acidipaludis]MBY8882435.1 DUF6215 domain-containing protein [Streptomyces acidipaludis]